MPSIHTNRGIGRARKARTALGLPSDRPLVDVVADVERTGGVHVVVVDLGEGVAGAYLRRPDCPLIFVNGREGAVRQRFTVAHEFGHHRLEHATVVDRVAALTDTGHDPQEVEANAFAAEFLVPRAALARLWSVRAPMALSLEHVVRVACAFGVSAQMARFRLESYGLLDRDRCQRLDEEIAAEEHLELLQRLELAEPADTIAASAGRLPRVPAPLRASAFGQFLAGELDVGQLAARVDRPVEAVERTLHNVGLGHLSVASMGGAAAPAAA